MLLLFFFPSYPACMSGVQQREAIREKMFGQGEVEKEDEGSIGSKANTEERLIKREDLY